MNALYPLKFKPIYKNKIWGGDKIKTVLNKDFSSLPNCGESWEISAVQGDISVVSNGFLKDNNLQELIEVYMGDLVGDKIYTRFGLEFPLLIKFIDANSDLSIQVHPGDELAKERHNSFGKTEMWYIIQAEKNAKLISGFNKELNKEEYLKSLENKTLPEILNFEKVQTGDVFFIPAGRVHAICSGILLAEIQQTSDITYRIYDWERKDENGKSRELHTDMALDAIDYKKYDAYKIQYEKILNKHSQLTECKYFTTNILEFNQQLKLDYSLLDSFVIYMCIEGSYTINNDSDNKTEVEQGETILVPATFERITLTPQPKAKILEIYIKHTI